MSQLIADVARRIAYLGADGTPILVTPDTPLPITGAGAGGGDVSKSGTPSAGQAAEWVTSTTIKGTAVTGTGSFVKATPPTLVTPALGTPTALVLTSATGLPLTTGVTGVLPTANAGVPTGGAIYNILAKTSASDHASGWARRAPTFTTAALLALSDADSEELSMAFCSDCLTPQGTGSLVNYDGAKWRSTTTSIEATTDMLTFFRSFSLDNGELVSIGKTISYFETVFAGSTNWTSQNSGTVVATAENAAESIWIRLNMITSATSGSRFTSVQQMYESQTSAIYQRRTVFIEAASDATNEYSFRTGIEDGFTFTIDPNFAGFVLDRGNSLGSLNAGNSGNYLCVSRASSTNTVTVTSVAPSTSVATPDVLEFLYTPGVSALYYINGTLVATHVTNLPTGVVHRADVSLRSAGTTARFVKISRIASILRIP